MYNFFKFMPLLLIITHSLNLNASEKVDSVFGRRADTIVIDINSIVEPKLSASGKSFVTENNFGFDVIHSQQNWVIEDFLMNIKPGQVVMDVGAGYGAFSRLALEKGAVVVNNDISERHQLYNLKHLKEDQKNRLYFNTQDIRQASFPNQSIDLIMLHRVLHFFTGKEIDSILLKTRQWLKSGGKVYIVMMSKDHVAFRDKIKYDESKQWPGEGLVIIKEHLPDQAYALPETLHVVSIDTLKKALERAGFQVEKADFLWKKLGSEANRDGREAVGIIASVPAS